MRSLLLLALTLGCVAETALTEADRSAIQREVEVTLRNAYDLSRPGVVERMLSLYPKSARVTSANAGRVQGSRDSLVAGISYFWENVGVNMREPAWVWDSLHTEVLGRDAAVVTASYRVPHLNPRGERHVLGGAMTVVFQRREGRWLVVHEHLSDLPQAP